MTKQAALHYSSTRGESTAVDFEETALAGLAPDGGLFLPDRFPRVPDGLPSLKGASYPKIVERIVAPFLGESVPPDTLASICKEAYGHFEAPDTVPLTSLEKGVHLLELFHGPTLTFKDFALQFLAHLFDHFLSRQNRRAMVLCATSGDTGSAAIEAFRGRKAVDIVVLHPRERISSLQRRMMTTVKDGSVYNFAIEGTFDDCQALVKGAFADSRLRKECGLLAVNSINWIRIAAQAAYYFHASLRADPEGRGAVFVVPSGNFGNCYAGHVAASMGLPVRRLVAATNRNDILVRFFESGRYQPGAVHRTISPAMDIQVASNFERLLSELHGRDGEAVRADMSTLAKKGSFQVAPNANPDLRARFQGIRVDDDETLQEMRLTHERNGFFVDPHTAVGLAAARKMERNDDAPVVVLSTAHPAKFSDVVQKATSQTPHMPSRLRECLNAPEHYFRIPSILEGLKSRLRHIAAGENAPL